jgi:hypothetical protein
MKHGTDLRRNLTLSALLSLGISGCIQQDVGSPETGEEPPLGETRQALEQPKTVSLNGCTGPALPLYRYWNPGNTDHFYTTNWGELEYGRSGWNIEGVAGWLPDASFSSCGAVPLHRYWNVGIGDHFYTTNWGELGYGKNGWTYEGVAGHCFPSPVTGTVPLYRYWNGSSGDHFYTTNWAELGAGQAGYAYEGIQCYVVP